MKKFWRILIAGVVFAAIVQGIAWWDNRGEGFRLYKIQEKIPYDARWDVQYSDEELKGAIEAMKRPYKYLGHGFQCYAFESEDGKYVLKFFRYQRLRLPEFVQSIPSLPFFDEWRKGRLLSLSRRRDYLLRSCKTSWDLARYETALLLVHLNETKGVFPKISLKDPLGDIHTISLDGYQFMLQRKAAHIKPTFHRLIQEGKMDEAKQHVDYIFDMLLGCAKKCVQDTDGALIRKNNLGFLEEEGRAIYIDGGKLAKKEGIKTKKGFEKDLERLRPLQKWFKEESQELATYFEEKKKNVLNNFEEHMRE